MVCKTCTYTVQSGEGGPKFGHANASFSVFLDAIRNKFLNKMSSDNYLNLHDDQIVQLASILHIHEIMYT